MEVSCGDCFDVDNAMFLSCCGATHWKGVSMPYHAADVCFVYCGKPLG